MRGHLPTGTVSSVIALHDAQAVVLDMVKRAIPVTLPINDIVGLVLAQDVVSTENVPPFANSAVDGFAVTLADMASGEATLRISGELAAGAAPNITVHPGEAVRIMTGAPVPPGAQAIVMVEDSAPGPTPDTVTLRAKVEPNQAIRPAGDDVKIGDTVFRAGDIVTPAALGVLASINATHVSVYPRAKVAVLSTGDELVDDGSPLALGQIRESNRTMLLRLVADIGCDAVDYGIVRDDEETLESILRDAARKCDAIVTSGGVSMGDYDVVKAVLGRIADMRWMQMSIKPAKPFAFGLLDGTPVFGLPGNPVSSFVSCELMARPALRKMMGHTQLHRPLANAVATDEFRRKPDGKVHFQRVVAAVDSAGNLTAAPVAAQGSHQLAATALANALAVLPDGPSIPTGETVKVMLIGPLTTSG
jgi:molybdenum cofactor synthesis domain-containing protein